MRKKLFSLILACCVIFTALIPVVSATSEPIVITANAVVAENGFYDNTADSVATAPEAGSKDGSIILKDKEWVKYDVSDLTAGTYTVSATYSQAKGVNNQVYLDTIIGDYVVSRKMLPVTKDAETFTTSELYKVYIPEGTNTITFKNSSTLLDSANVPMADIESFTLTYVSAEDTSDGVIVSNTALHMLNTTDGDGFAYNSSSSVAVSSILGSVSGTARAHLRSPGRWIKYDVSDIKPGSYRLLLSAAAQAASPNYPPSINLYLDDVLLGNYVPATSGNVGSQDCLTLAYEKTNSMGIVTITESSEILKMQCGGHYIYASDFTLEPVSVMSACNIVSGGQGVGFYDNTIDSEATAPEAGSKTGSVILKSKEWVKYDVSDLNPGTYTIIVNYAAASGVNNQVYFDTILEEKVVTRKKLPVTTNATTFSSTDLYKVYISEDTETITFRNSSTVLDVASVPTVDVEGFTFIYESADDISERKIVSSTAQNVINTKLYDATSTPDGGYYNTSAISGMLASVAGTPRTHLRSPGRWFKYDISDFASGMYKLTISAAGSPAGASWTPSIKVYLDDVEVGTYIVGDTGTSLTLAQEKINDEIYIKLTNENKTLKFECAGHYVYASDFALEKAVSNAEMAFTDIDANELKDIGENTLIYADTTVLNADSAQIKVLSVVAIYEGSKLVSATPTIETIDAEVSKFFSKELTVSAGQTVKLFTWTINGEDITMTPLGEAASIS